MTSMMNLRVFMSERLSSAAIEIFDEVEKVITLYEAEVTRSREEVRYLQKQLEIHRLKDHPDINNGIVIREDASITPRQVNMAATIKREEGSTRSMDDEESEHSQTNVDSTYTNNAIQLDISKIKEEREVMCIDSEGLDVHTTTTTVNIMNRDRDPEQPDMEVRSTYEIADFLSMCPSALTSDPQEEWSKQRQKTKEFALAVQRESNGLALNQELTPLPLESASTRNQNSDQSFCHLCGKPFRYIGSLMKHIKMHDDHTVICGICNRSCHNINDLLSHLRCAHRGSYFCHICGKTFSKQCFLIIHSKQHKGLRQLACEDWHQSSSTGAF
ncbi:zinc finger protein 652-B-like [Gadus chalcogrammus]|uniref:zinc finger protein 652-B-like n=1 Tax=Gadus chalcogrammus TaxID=1042646 RepID=UPI0024C41CCE|nr:zinc finger protein 652-B-like [Gadus chalcogrammus]